MVQIRANISYKFDKKRQTVYDMIKKRLTNLKINMI